MDEVLDRTSSILILGGSGYLGKSLIKELETRKIAFCQIKHSMTHYEMKEIIVSNLPLNIENLCITSYDTGAFAHLLKNYNLKFTKGYFNLIILADSTYSPTPLSHNSLAINRKVKLLGLINTGGNKFSEK